MRPLWAGIGRVGREADPSYGPSWNQVAGTGSIGHCKPAFPN